MLVNTNKGPVSLHVPIVVHEVACCSICVSSPVSRKKRQFPQIRAYQDGSCIAHQNTGLVPNCHVNARLESVQPEGWIEQMVVIRSLTCFSANPALIISTH